jgi:hypothetical protein
MGEAGAALDLTRPIPAGASPIVALAAGYLFREVGSR